MQTLDKFFKVKSQAELLFFAIRYIDVDKMRR